MAFWVYFYFPRVKGQRSNYSLIKINYKYRAKVIMANWKVHSLPKAGVLTPGYLRITGGILQHEVPGPQPWRT